MANIKKARKRIGGARKSRKEKRSGFANWVAGWFLKTFMLVSVVGILMAMAAVIVVAAAALWFFNSRVWNGVNRISVLVHDRQTGGVRLYSYQNGALDGVDAVVVDLGGDTLVEAVHGYGEYRLGVLPKLGAQEGYGDKLLADTVEGWLGVKIGGVIEVDRLVKTDSGKQKWQQLGRVLWQGTYNSVPVWDRWSLWWKSRGLGSSKVSYFDLSESGMYKQELLLDGTRVFRVLENKLDVLVGSYLADSYVSGKSGVGVSVVNTTGRAGLARKVARVLSNVGYDVVSVDDEPGPLETSEILVEGGVVADNLFLYPMEELLGVRGVVSEELVANYRAVVVVKIGKDIEKLLYDK